MENDETHSSVESLDLTDATSDVTSPVFSNSDEFTDDATETDEDELTENSARDLPIEAGESDQDIESLRRLLQRTIEEKASLEMKVCELEDMINKLISLNEQIMRDKEIVYATLRRVNDEKTALEQTLAAEHQATHSVGDRTTHTQALDVVLNASVPSKDVKVLNVNFEKYLFLRYTASRPFPVICVLNEGKIPAKVVCQYQQETAQLSLEEYFFYQPLPRAAGVRVKDGETVLALSPTSSRAITVEPLPPVLDRFHRIVSPIPSLTGKRPSYMTVVDLRDWLTNGLIELKAFGVIFEGAVQEKIPGGFDVYDDYLDKLRKLSCGVVVLYVESAPITDLILNQTKETVVKPPVCPQGVFFVESKALQVEKLNVPFMFPIKWRPDPQYLVAFFTSSNRSVCHVIRVVSQP